MIVEALTVASVIALWLIVLAAGADRFFLLFSDREPVFFTKRHALFAAPIIAVAALAITYLRHQPIAERTPVPCAGDGVDYDIRDGLCYHHVPMKFQRR